MTGVRGVYVACVFFEPPTVLISFYSKNLSDITLYLNYYVLWGKNTCKYDSQKFADILTLVNESQKFTDIFFSI